MPFDLGVIARQKVPSPIAVVEYLVVAGGGGSGPNATGGGGGGGFLEGTSHLVPGTYTITVGAGGPTAASQYVSGGQGEDSLLPVASGTITAFGGGHGGAYSASIAPAVGGSGGGGTGRYLTGADGIPGQGNKGGTALKPSQGSYSGGGGGAGGPGGDALNTNVDALGGLGLSRDITGSAVTYAFGGRGNKYENYDNARNAAANTGGGGGAARDGGNGGSGIVVMKLLASVTVTPTGTPEVINDGVYNTYIFRSSDVIEVEI